MQTTKLMLEKLPNILIVKYKKKFFISFLISNLINLLLIHIGIFKFNL
jgi:hypothetical protein